jgi:hypothetical protein
MLPDSRQKPFQHENLMSYQFGTETSGVYPGITYGEHGWTFSTTADWAKDYKDQLPNLSLGLQYAVCREYFHLKGMPSGVYVTPPAPDWYVQEDSQSRGFGLYTGTHGHLHLSRLPPSADGYIPDVE